MQTLSRKLRVLATAIVSMVPLLSDVTAHADFFLDRVTAEDSENANIDAITLSHFRFKNAANAQKYRDGLFFLSAVKTEAKKRLADGRMDGYAFADVVNELSYLTYHLNQYFGNLAAFERTGKAFYKGFAAEDLAVSKTSYDRLKAVTRKK